MNGHYEAPFAPDTDPALRPPTGCRVTWLSREFRRPDRRRSAARAPGCGLRDFRRTHRRPTRGTVDGVFVP